MHQDNVFLTDAKGIFVVEFGKNFVAFRGLNSMLNISYSTAWKTIKEPMS